MALPQIDIAKYEGYLAEIAKLQALLTGANRPKTIADYINLTLQLAALYNEVAMLQNGGQLTVADIEAAHTRNQAQWPDPLANPPERAKYNQWLRLPTPGLMPTNESLKAQLFAVGDITYNDGDGSNAAEFYLVTGPIGIAVPNSPTGRPAVRVGTVG